MDLDDVVSLRAEDSIAGIMLDIKAEPMLNCVHIIPDTVDSDEYELRALVRLPSAEKKAGRHLAEAQESSVSLFIFLSEALVKRNDTMQDHL